MRQGNVFSQQIYVKDKNEKMITIPYEIAYEIDSFSVVVWTDNRDGTFTLRFKNG